MLHKHAKCKVKDHLDLFQDDLFLFDLLRGSALKSKELVLFIEYYLLNQK